MNEQKNPLDFYLRSEASDRSFRTLRENAMAIYNREQPDYYFDLMDAIQIVPDPVLLGGMFMDTSCLLTIMTPLLCPMLGTYDINVLHFGAICVLNMTLGTLSPPFGGGVFVAAGVTNQPVTEIFRSNMPLLLSGIAILMGVTYVPLLWL